MRKDRKTKIEQVHRQAVKLARSEQESAEAWFRLCSELDTMSHPEARPPRFAHLLNALWRAATNES